MNSDKKTGFRFSGKGYYIALILCVIAIGIAGYVYYRNVNEEPNPQLEEPAASVGKNDVPAVATDPTLGTNPSKPTEPPKTTVQPRKVTAPLEGKTVTDFAMDCLAYNPTTRDWRVHNGIDIAAEAGAPVMAAADGTVYTVFEDETMGTTVILRHGDGYVTRYASLDPEVSVKAGDTVKAGQVIGKVANTALLETAIGDHIHFSVTLNDKPVDPEKFLNP